MWLALAGCAAYHAPPLTPETVKAALAVRPASALWVRRASAAAVAAAAYRAQGRAANPEPCGGGVAVVGDPAWRALRAQEAVARAQVLTAGLLPDPVFSYGVGLPLSAADLTRALCTALGLPLQSLVTRAPRIKNA